MAFHDRAADQAVPEIIFADSFATLGEAKHCGWDSLANWVILTRFLATGGRD
jgi:hypothetical protein